MPDREKVTQGLLHHKGNKTPSPCDGCPYDDEEPHCSQRRAEDALALLVNRGEQRKEACEYKPLSECTPTQPYPTGQDFNISLTSGGGNGVQLLGGGRFIQQLFAQRSEQGFTFCQSGGDRDA